ncbi:endoplasmic reticulum mannosyl-oligosaccharide 1,2-alpha-mannosidase [Gaeumannomyces tritici R3-111a-1]|uniref:alpha-1,2-Mannosidase n=1 Tax=Gaeumannomyces tritici (strain R3-111a-1) TaxID=644352 RepID=J3NN08_GAET3|nr:endoplasmic reticulum mannosyl-oligosaccharide 1,2-alpha-mannosidase [Gaeumannomyces tritici R3-111a-1]EJT77560.1 endoplasmic reticulum mannosyl-oligosaccharide 1,2-alpha-mannosidase [Gaeumannomyces tritici R3-111a-1]
MSIASLNALKRRALPLLFVLVFFAFLLHHNRPRLPRTSSWQVTPSSSSSSSRSRAGGGQFSWANVPLHYPVPPESMRRLPDTTGRQMPRIQHVFSKETAADRKVRLERLALVKSNFTHAWNGYKLHAWMSDEVRPISGGAHNPFGGWAATLVDALDTLWIMGMKSEFDEAVRAIDQIDFSSSTLEEINVFETTIRYMGGFLAAYDISGGRSPSLLRKAIELGDMLYIAFDTPNHLPITRWRLNELKQARTGGSGPAQVAPPGLLVAEIGSLTLEFTRLSQLSGDPKYFDAVQRVMEVFADEQDKTHLPGLWPVVVNAEKPDFTGDGWFTIGGMADSTYEYLPKQYLLLNGGSLMYRDLYVKAIAAMKRNIFFRPRTKSSSQMLMPGDARADGSRHWSKVEQESVVQHLGCFAGGMVGLAARALDLPGDIDVARQLVEGCLWSYETAPSGFMPEVMHVTRCPRNGPCAWDETEWHTGIKERAKAAPGANVAETIRQQRLSPGVVSVDDRRYILRPEAIESIFILYRLTGEQALADRGWSMFENIVQQTQTDVAHAALADCTAPEPSSTRTDSMESFWLAETLKYFYLLYSTPDVVSLDEYVLNTEAHPLRRPL